MFPCTSKAYRAPGIKVDSIWQIRIKSQQQKHRKIKARKSSTIHFVSNQNLNLIFFAKLQIFFPAFTNSRPANPDTHSVIVTGNFDDWSQSQGVLTKDVDTGSFEAVLRLRERQKLVFKFVLNGSEWVTDDAYKVEYDEHGNPNNYVDASELIEVHEFTKEETPKAETPEFSPLAVASSERGPVELPEAATTESAAAKETTLPTSDEEKLTNVLTSDSSYAAVSIPGSGSSGFESISDEDDFDPSNRNARHRTAPEDVTPTSSNPGLKRPAGSGAADSEVTTLGSNSRSSSFTGRPQQSDCETVDVMKVPGSFPSPVKSDEKVHGRRDGLITRLRGLFRS